MTGDRNAPRRKGDARRPAITARVVAGLARLPDLVPSSLILGDAELTAALDYVSRLAAHENRADVIAQRDAARALTNKARKAQKETKQ